VAVANRLRQELRGTVEAYTGEQAAYLELRRELILRCFGEEVITSHPDALQAWTVQLAEGEIAAPSALAPQEFEHDSSEDEEPAAAVGPEDGAASEEAVLEAPPKMIYIQHFTRY